MVVYILQVKQLGMVLFSPGAPDGKRGHHGAPWKQLNIIGIIVSLIQ